MKASSLYGDISKHTGNRVKEKSCLMVRKTHFQFQGSDTTPEGAISTAEEKKTCFLISGLKKSVKIAELGTQLHLEVSVAKNKMNVQ